MPPRIIIKPHETANNGGCPNYSQARAVEEASILENWGENVVHSISPKNPAYDDVVSWGQEFLKSIRQ